MSKFIILDRDGVINEESPEYVKSPEEWLPIPGSLDAIASLTRGGFTICVATNQSGIAKGKYTASILDQIHHKMQSELEKIQGKIDKVFFCPHQELDNCSCRKPKTGMLKQIEEHYKINLKEKEIFFVGDSLRDLEAAHSMGLRPVLVLTGFGKKTQSVLPTHLQAVPQFPDLQAASQWILANC